MDELKDWPCAAGSPGNCNSANAQPEYPTNGDLDKTGIERHRCHSLSEDRMLHLHQSFGQGCQGVEVTWKLVDGGTRSTNGDMAGSIFSASH